MSVERRYNKRHSVHFNVNILYRGRRFPFVYARNLSPVGMFLQTAGITLHSDVLVELEFQRGNRDWLISAIIVHNNERGVGVMFREPYAEFQEATISTPDRSLPQLASGESNWPG